MTKEALKLALEALVDLRDQTETPPDGNCSCHIAPPCADCVNYSGIRHAIKQATKAATDIREALAKPEEPVDLHNRLADLHLYEEVAEHYAKCAISPEALRDWVAERVNTPPSPVQEPERQPLTDEEMDLICEKALFCKISFQQFGRSIEAAHNIGAKP